MIAKKKQKKKKARLTYFLVLIAGLVLNVFFLKCHLCVYFTCLLKMTTNKFKFLVGKLQYYTIFSSIYAILC